MSRARVIGEVRETLVASATGPPCEPPQVAKVVPEPEPGARPYGSSAWATPGSATASVRAASERALASGAHFILEVYHPRSIGQREARFFAVFFAVLAPFFAGFAVFFAVLAALVVCFAAFAGFAVLFAVFAVFFAPSAPPAAFPAFRSFVAAAVIFASRRSTSARETLAGGFSDGKSAS